MVLFVSTDQGKGRRVPLARPRDARKNACLFVCYYIERTQTHTPTAQKANTSPNPPRIEATEPTAT